VRTFCFLLLIIAFPRAEAWEILGPVPIPPSNPLTREKIELGLVAHEPDVLETHESCAPRVATEVRSLFRVSKAGAPVNEPQYNRSKIESVSR
jgi:hypothetical protein